MQQSVQCKIGQKIFAWAIQTEGVFLVALQNKALIDGRNIVDDDLWCVVGQEAGQLKFSQISYGVSISLRLMEMMCVNVSSGTSLLLILSFRDQNMCMKFRLFSVNLLSSMA